MNLEPIITQIREKLDSTHGRIIIGIIGKPGAGKSTVTNEISKHFDRDLLSTVSMDGYHLSNEVLLELGIHNRKGAPDTFDILGFSQLLNRIKHEQESTIYFPIFHREIEESIYAEGKIVPDTKVVLVEGNYLLSDDYGWNQVREQLDFSWYIHVPEELRQARLIARHVEYGKTEEEAMSWALGSDEQNALYIEKTAHLATSVLELG